MRGRATCCAAARYLVRQRAELLAHLQNTNSQYNLPAFGKKLAYAAKNRERDLAERFADPSVAQQRRGRPGPDRRTTTSRSRELELYLARTAKVDDAQALPPLQSMPGIGKILALILLYEIHDIRRFAESGQFLSYARLVNCAHESAGKKQGIGGNKIGNAHLKWAFSEAASCSTRQSADGQGPGRRIAKKHGKGKALPIFAHKMGAPSTDCSPMFHRRFSDEGTLGRSPLSSDGLTTSRPSHSPTSSRRIALGRLVPRAGIQRLTRRGLENRGLHPPTAVERTISEMAQQVRPARGRADNLSGSQEPLATTGCPARLSILARSD